MSGCSRCDDGSLLAFGMGAQQYEVAPKIQRVPLLPVDRAIVERQLRRGFVRDFGHATLGCSAVLLVLVAVGAVVVLASEGWAALPEFLLSAAVISACFAIGVPLLLALLPSSCDARQARAAVRQKALSDGFKTVAAFDVSAMVTSSKDGCSAFLVGPRSFLIPARPVEVSTECSTLGPSILEVEYASDACIVLRWRLVRAPTICRFTPERLRWKPAFDFMHSIVDGQSGTSVQRRVRAEVLLPIYELDHGPDDPSFKLFERMLKDVSTIARDA